jgi:hypothetical protein
MYEGVNMKKLLILTLVIMLVGIAQAQRDTMFVNIGPLDVSPNPGYPVGVDKNVEVPVFFHSDETVDYDLVEPFKVQGADLSYPMGINNCYADMFIEAECQILYPLSGWDSKSFGNLNEDYMTDGDGCAWDSYSFTGFAELFPPYDSPLLETDGTDWVNALIYVVHTVNRPELIDSVICNPAAPGVDPVSGPPNCGDPEGGAGWEVFTTVTCWWFSPNQNCTLIPPELPTDCTYEDFSVDFDVYDPDGDTPTVTSSVGTVVYTGQTADEPPDEGITFHYTLDFDMEDFCGTCFSGDVIITAVDADNYPEEPQIANIGTLAVIGSMTAWMDPALYIWPGMEEWMPVYLDACGDCFCLGGFVFSIEYDASILAVTDVVRGDALVGGEYWNVIYNVDGPGTIRVTFINDLNNQTPVEDICALDPEVPLFEMKFLLSGEFEYPLDFCVDICFMFDGEGEDHYEYNNVSDKDGYHVWMNDGCDDPPDSIQFGTLDLNMVCGNIKVMDEHNVEIGDVNLNGYAFDVGDAVLLANHLIDPAAFPFTLRQMIASDVNDDGLYATIADLIYMINVINNVGVGGKIAPLDVIATVAMPVDTYGDVNVTVTSDLSVGGALIAINHTGVELGAPTAEGLTIDYRDNGDVMNVLVYNEDVHNPMTSGTNVLFTLPVLTEGSINFGDVSISDSRGALLDARTAYDAPIPTEFSVAQNFPNPFNAKTSLSFGLPEASEVAIYIYNVAGQLVETMDLGRVDAGTQSVVWDASDVASGIYFYKVVAGDNNETMKMTLLK